METDEKRCVGCGEKLVDSPVHGVRLICPNYFVGTDNPHTMIPEPLVRGEVVVLVPEGGFDVD